MPYRFAEFELEDDGRELRRRDERIEAAPKVLAFLHALVRAAPRVVTRSELLESVWNGQIVSPSAVNTVAKSLRRILDDGEQRAIRTVHGIGYAFTLPVEHQRRGASSARAPVALADARQRLFVGREPELVRLSAWFVAPPASEDARLFWVHGVGGIGKTTLIHRLEALAHAHGVRVIAISCAHVQPSPNGVRGAIAAAGGASTASDVSQALASSDVGLLVFDGYEAFRGIDDWVRERFLQRLPPGWRLVIAGRNAPGARWLADPSWTHAEELPLEDLAPHEAEALLERRGIPAEARGSLVRFAGGHPLTLVLAAGSRPSDGLARSALATEALAAALVDSFVRDAPSKVQRDALECIAVAETLDEPLLAAMLEDPAAAGDCFDWLATLGMVDRIPAGLVLHDLARMTLLRNLAWRSRARLSLLAERVHDELFERLSRIGSQAERRRIVGALCRLAAVHPALASLMAPLGICGAASRAELEAVEEHVERFEGPVSAAALRFWLARDPACANVVRADDGTMLGYSVMIDVEPGDAEARAADPVVGEIRAALPRRAKMSVARWFADCRSYHALTPVSLRCHQLNAERDLATLDPELEFHVALVADAEAWSPIVAVGNFGTPRRRIDIGGRELTMFALDLVEQPLLTWFREFTRRVMGTAEAGPSLDLAIR